MTTLPKQDGYSIIERVRAAIRAFVLGPAVATEADRAWGHDVAEWSPAEYGDYIATSNGVYACATQRAQFLASLPLKLYAIRQGEKQEIVKGELYDLLQKVNSFWTFTRLVEMTELTLCLWGQAFWFLERGENGKMKPREIWWGKPTRVRVVPHPSEYVAGYLYQPEMGGMEIAYRPDEVIWLRYPNPNDEYAPLSPLTAARLAADYASAAMKSNWNLFTNGIQAGGLVVPAANQIFSDEQARDLERALERRFRGVDKAHRWGVLRLDAEVKELGFTPEEAEFLGGLHFSLEEICRAYKWPLDLVGGQRTYENVNAAMKAAWTNAVIPEARFIASEITEQLLPMFPGQADLAEFDSSDVDVLQEGESERWTRSKEQIQAGAITINEWRDDQGLEAVSWGDVWWAPATLLPVSDPHPALPLQGEGGTQQAAIPKQNGYSIGYELRAIEYDSPEHQRLFNRFVRRTGGYEKAVTRVATALFERQRDSVLDRLRARVARSPSEAAEEPFDMAQWVKAFRVEMRPVIVGIVDDSGQAAMDDLALTLTFDVAQPAVVRFLERRAQRFAQRVNETTWDALKLSLRQGIEAGENIKQLEERVTEVMAERIRSTPETIARTEVVGAANGGTLEAWRQSEVVESKVWLAALDDRTRESHVEAHGQTVGLDEDFVVGGASGPAPGQMGDPDEDINCRCSMTAGLKQRVLLPPGTAAGAAGNDGHGRINDVAISTRVL